MSDNFLGNLQRGHSCQSSQAHCNRGGKVPVRRVFGPLDHNFGQVKSGQVALLLGGLDGGSNQFNKLLAYQNNNLVADKCEKSIILDTGET